MQQGKWYFNLSSVNWWTEKPSWRLNGWPARRFGQWVSTGWNHKSMRVLQSVNENYDSIQSDQFAVENQFDNRSTIGMLLIHPIAYFHTLTAIANMHLAFDSNRTCDCQIVFFFASVRFRTALLRYVALANRSALGVREFEAEFCRQRRRSGRGPFAYLAVVPSAVDSMRNFNFCQTTGMLPNRRYVIELFRINPFNKS